MTPGDIILVSMPKKDGKTKKRPALILQYMRPFGDVLVCGISSQVQFEVKGFDLVLDVNDDHFEYTGLKKSSVIRLGYITTVSKSVVPGKIGTIPSELLDLLISRLINYLSDSNDLAPSTNV